MITTEKELSRYYQEHLDSQKKIWDECEQKLIEEYISQGYFIWWAREKARKEVLQLRSMPNNGID